MLKWKTYSLCWKLLCTMAAHHGGTSFSMDFPHVDFQEVFRFENSLTLITLVRNFLLELYIVLSCLHFVAPMDPLLIEIKGTDCKKSHAFCTMSKVGFVAIQKKIMKIGLVLDLFSECYSMWLPDVDNEAVLLILWVEAAAHTRCKLDIALMQLQLLDEGYIVLGD